MLCEKPSPCCSSWPFSCSSLAWIPQHVGPYNRTCGNSLVVVTTNQQTMCFGYRKLMNLQKIAPKALLGSTTGGSISKRTLATGLNHLGSKIGGDFMESTGGFNVLGLTFPIIPKASWKVAGVSSLVYSTHPKNQSPGALYCVLECFLNR